MYLFHLWWGISLSLFDGQHLSVFYASDSVHGRKGYFNTNLESTRKDAECTFWILKKRWQILDCSFNYYCIKDCEKIFTVCCVLHNVLLGNGETFGYQVIAIRGWPFDWDSLWLEGPTDLNKRLADDAGLCPVRRITLLFRTLSRLDGRLSCKENE